MQATPRRLLLCWIAAALTVQAGQATVADRDLAAYFEDQVSQIMEAGLAEVRSAADWHAQREERRRQLLDMLGLWPLPPRTDLKAAVTGVVDEGEVTVEKLHFQSLPGLYVTANLYIPKGLSGPAPAILYVCGHALVKTNDISFGNKTAYQHHGAWLAKHGYVCLTIDTLQLGEIEGRHHGTYRLGEWWWNSRGYTPAGVEAWNSIRAIDYLESRPEVDRQRIGMTGRSGGGSYTWTTAALDDRIKAAAPVAGMTDLRNHVVDGVVEGHCDCMYYLNSYRWDFPLHAALIAPRPLLIVNTDSDTIFPLDGVVRVHREVRRIYGLLGASNKLGLVIAPGPHKDTQDLQVPVFRWFNQHLRDADPLITNAATRLFDPARLRVFEALPADQRNTRIDMEFGPQASAPPMGTDAGRTAIIAELRRLVFGGWPDAPRAADPATAFTIERDRLRLSRIAFASQPHVPLSLWVLEPAGNKAASLELRVVDSAAWLDLVLLLSDGFGEELAGELPAAEPDSEAHAGFVALADRVRQEKEAVAWLAPRGIGSGAWSGDQRRQTQIRRRFMLLGQTLDSMRVWDIRQALDVLRQARPEAAKHLTVRAAGDMAVNALYAGLFEPRDSVRFDLSGMPASHQQGPDYLNVKRVIDLPQSVELLRTLQVVEVR